MRWTEMDEKRLQSLESPDLRDCSLFLQSYQASKGNFLDQTTCTNSYSFPFWENSAKDSSQGPVDLWLCAYFVAVHVDLRHSSCTWWWGRMTKFPRLSQVGASKDELAFPSNSIA